MLINSLINIKEPIRKLIAEGYPICTNEDIYVKALETHFLPMIQP